MAAPQPPRSAPLTCSGHTRPVVHLQFSALQPDNKYLMISSCKDGNPMLRDWTGDWIGTFLGHKGAVWSAKLSNDTSRAVTGSADFSAKIWDTFTGTELLSFPHQHIVKSVAVSADASYVMTGGHEKKLRLYDLKHPSDDPLYFVDSSLQTAGNSDSPIAHGGNIKSILWDEQRGTAISAGEDKVVRWWDLRTLNPIAKVTVKDPITSMEHSVGGNVVTITAGKEVHFLDSERRELLQTHVLEHDPSSASLHPTASKFVTGSTSDPWVHVYDYETGAKLDVNKGHHGPVHTVEWSPDGEVYASGSEDGTIRLWQYQPGKTYGLWSSA